MRPVPKALRALRGATTVDEDTREQVFERVNALLEEMLDANGIHNDDLVSIIFTATDDIHSVFPATAARKSGLGDVPLAVRAAESLAVAAHARSPQCRSGAERAGLRLPGGHSRLVAAGHPRPGRQQLL
jgi:chorismate mutase